MAAKLIYKRTGVRVRVGDHVVLRDGVQANPRVKPVHYAPTYCQALCVSEARKKKGSRFFGGYRRSTAYTVSDWEDVTCKRCLNLHAAEEKSHV